MFQKSIQLKKSNGEQMTKHHLFNYGSVMLGIKLTKYIKIYI